MSVRPGRHRDNTGSALHLLDLENLVAGRVTPDSVRRVWQDYSTTVGVTRGDRVVVAVAARSAAAAMFNIPASVQWAIGSNVADGADRALVEAVDVAHAAHRYRRVYIASGDHYFTGLARTFRDLGCAVTQVIGAARPSAELYRACNADVRIPTGIAA